jgi:uncharacterized protein with HEPN domain
MKKSKFSDQKLFEFLFEFIDEIEIHLSKTHKDKFYTDITVREATIHSLQKFAETTQRISDEVKSKIPEVPWREISGMRNVIVHDYLGDVDYEIVWDVATIKIPEIKKVLKEFYSKFF